MPSQRCSLHCSRKVEPMRYRFLLYYPLSFFYPAPSSPLVIPRRIPPQKEQIQIVRKGSRNRGIEFIFFLRMEYARLKYLRNDPRWRGEKVRSNRMENICTFKILKFTRHSGKRIFDRTHVTMRNFFFFAFFFFAKKKRVVGFFEM